MVPYSALISLTQPYTALSAEPHITTCRPPQQLGIGYALAAEAEERNPFD